MEAEAQTLAKLNAVFLRRGHLRKHVIATAICRDKAEASISVIFLEHPGRHLFAIWAKPICSDMSSVLSLVLRRYDVPTGVLKMFNEDRGFGFIRQEEGGEDVFVHVSAGERAGIQLRQGMRLGFDVGQDRKTGKSRAENLRLV